MLTEKLETAATLTTTLVPFPIEALRLRTKPWPRPTKRGVTRLLMALCFVTVSLVTTGVHAMPPECEVVADCGPCALECSELGECHFGGDDACQVSEDCGPGATCDTSGLCGNVCVDALDPGCDEAECVGDAECEGGEVCIVDSCGGFCVYIEPECEVVADCGPCALECSEHGECLFGGDDACQVSEDCGPGATCDTSGLCGNVCVEAVELECEVDADCGTCFAVCVAGACAYTGDIECEADADCSSGQVCDAALCGGTCVDLNSTHSNPTSSAGEGCSTTGGGAGFPTALLMVMAALWAARRRHPTRPTA